MDLATARAHVQVWAELAAAGSMIGLHDLWLVATGIVHGLTMLTANVREFAWVPGLEVCAMAPADRAGSGGGTWS